MTLLPSIAGGEEAALARVAIIGGGVDDAENMRMERARKDQQQNEAAAAAVTASVTASVSHNHDANNYSNSMRQNVQQAMMLNSATINNGIQRNPHHQQQQQHPHAAATPLADIAGAVVGGGRRGDVFTNTNTAAAAAPLALASATSTVTAVAATAELFDTNRKQQQRWQELLLLEQRSHQQTQPQQHSIVRLGVAKQTPGKNRSKRTKKRQNDDASSNWNPFTGARYDDASFSISSSSSSLQLKKVNSPQRRNCLQVNYYYGLIWDTTFYLLYIQLIVLAF